MKTITQEEWDEKVRLHEVWLKYRSSGQKLELEGYDLSKLVFKKNKDLRLANLKCSNFQGMDLKFLDLRTIELNYADFRNADLSYSDLSRSDLTYSNLEYAALKGAILENTHIDHANLYNTTGNREEIKTYHLGKYTVNITSKLMQIGRNNHSIKKWFQLKDSEIKKLHPEFLDWWKNFKYIIKRIIEKDPAVDTSNYYWIE
jgi:hypothetical protein